MTIDVKTKKNPTQEDSALEKTDVQLIQDPMHDIKGASALALKELLKKKPKPKNLSILKKSDANKERIIITKGIPIKLLEK